ncbi:MFS transporter [Alkalihalobacterium sp. APHAB7]|uniref:MFS transporter n=1 Tax=Alkalihalobacterium sp. APHAB7 TaxID=3402081 RepID=UPI003AB0899A
MTYITKDHSSYYQTIIALFSGSFVSFMILYSMQTLIPVFSNEFDVTPAVASLALSITTGFLAMTMLVTAIVSDSTGRKRMMTGALLLSSLLCILTAFSSNFTSLLAIRALQGLALAGFPGIAMTYVSEEFHPKTLGVVMGIYVSGTTLGGLSGRLITGALTDWFSWQIAVSAIGGVSILLSLLFWTMLPTDMNSTRSKYTIKKLIPSLVSQLKDRKLLGLFIISFVLMGGFVTVYNYISFVLMEAPYHLSQTMIGLVFLIYLVGTFSSTYMGKVSDQFGKQTMLPVTIIIMLVGAVLTLSSNLWLIMLALAIFTFGFFGSHSIASSMVGQLATNYKSQAASLYLLCYYLGSSVIGTSSGVIWVNFEWTGIVLTICGLILIALLMVVWIRVELRREVHVEDKSQAI